MAFSTKKIGFLANDSILKNYPFADVTETNGPFTNF